MRAVCDRSQHRKKKDLHEYRKADRIREQRFCSDQIIAAQTEHYSVLTDRPLSKGGDVFSYQDTQDSGEENGIRPVVHQPAEYLLRIVELMERGMFHVVRRSMIAGVICVRSPIDAAVSSFFRPQTFVGTSFSVWFRTDKSSMFPWSLVKISVVLEWSIAFSVSRTNSLRIGRRPLAAARSCAWPILSVRKCSYITK